MPETLHALIAARLDGLSAEERRLLQDGSGARQDVHARRRSRRSPGSTEAELEPLLASLVRKEVLGVQADPARPSTASTASSRTSCATSPTRRSRSGSARAPPRRGRVPRARRSPTTRTRSPRSSRRTTSTRYEARPDADGRGRGPGARRRSCSCARATAPSRSARPAEALRYFEQAAELDRRSVASGPTLLDRAGEMAATAGDPDCRAPALRGGDRALRGSRATRTRPPACLGRLACGRRAAGTPRRGARRGWSARTRSSRRTSPTRTSRCSPRVSRTATGSPATSSGPPSAPSSRSTSPRRMRTRRPSRWR